VQVPAGANVRKVLAAEQTAPGGDVQVMLAHGSTAHEAFTQLQAMICEA
jgi:endonuclease/exonuclease/phosphatase family metal-dependent hydrolase